MTRKPARSLKYEYELYVEEEIECYKESIPRSALLKIGDEAVSSLADQAQLALTELLLTEEVDRIIFRRLQLPSYSTWRRRRLKLLAEMRRPEHWGLHPDDVVVRAVRTVGDAHVLLAGDAAESSALYFAANGCDVTAVADEEDVLERVLSAAAAVGLTGRVHAYLTNFSDWAPESELHAVIVTGAALRGLTPAERERVITLLQSATADGGVHLVQTMAGRVPLNLSELETRYEGWSVSVERPRHGEGETFLARKELS